MTSTVLVTGGAGFIGCAISPALVAHYDRVVAVDNMHPQIHATDDRPAALADGVELVKADITEAGTWDRLLASTKPTAVVHLAAETGTGQSLLESNRHALVNVVGTTQMLDAFTRHDALPERILLTSSRAVYGEGAWTDEQGNLFYPGQRSEAMLAAGQWDFPGLKPLPFDSRRTVAGPTSIYGATKLAQEHLIRAWALSFQVTPIFYRLQNVYGVGQSLINPYTGIVNLFARKARAGEPIPVYEDGDIVRDFVYITDVASAIVEGLRHSPGNNDAYDIGLGEKTTMLDVARVIAGFYHAPEPIITGQFRNGDVRAASCTLDGSVADLNWRPQVSVQEGLTRLCTWIEEQATPAP